MNYQTFQVPKHCKAPLNLRFEALLLTEAAFTPLIGCTAENVGNVVDTEQREPWLCAFHSSL